MNHNNSVFLTLRITVLSLLIALFSFNIAWSQGGEAQYSPKDESVTALPTVAPLPPSNSSNSQLGGEAPLPVRAAAREQENASAGRFDTSPNSEQAPHSSLLTPNSQNSFSITSLLSPDGIMGSMGTLLALGVLTLAPALIVMTTSFVRIVVVLGLLRQALGVQNLPPQQVITGLALFITFFVMYPVGNEIYTDALKPYEEGKITVTQAWDIGVKPLRQFMSAQIQKAGNDADVWLFWRADPDVPTGAAAQNLTYDDVPLHVLIPAFMTSELKIAFLMGVKLFIPFLIIDFLVSAITVSMGIMTLPPVMISLPLKLLLFVMLDGWRLTVEMLLTSFG